MIRTTVRLPDDLLDQAKAHARRTGRTLTHLLEQALRSELAQSAAIARVAERSAAYVVHAKRPSTDATRNEPTIRSTAHGERAAAQLVEQVQELQAFLGALPDLDHRTPDEILGYNADGLPE